jgi:ADP-heptose:LPS heptosyltransferase
LSLIQNAKLIISNDTGLAHAAGAMNKNILILWKDTPFIKNQNPGLNTKYCYKKDWSDCIKEFLNQSVLI